MICLDPHFLFIRKLSNKYRFNLSSEAKRLDDYHNGMSNYENNKPVKYKCTIRVYIYLKGPVTFLKKLIQANNTRPSIFFFIKIFSSS